MSQLPDQLYTLLRVCNAISFDIFDTLVKRDVRHPSDVFALTEMRYNLQSKHHVEKFAKRRINAEKCARSHVDGVEITLDQIYAELLEPPETIEELKRTEIETELAVCVPNVPLVAVYQKLLQEGKPIYLVSNMYLPRSVIEAILSKCGITGYQKLYLSSEVGCQKENGLFSKFIETEKLQKQNVIHVGDSLRSDVLAVRKTGFPHFRPYKIEYSPPEFPYRVQAESSSFSADIVNAFISNHFPSHESYFYQMGFAIYGPLMDSFLKWAIQRVDESGVRKILFLARDAYVMQKAFQIMRRQDIADVYFYLSRKSIFGTRLNHNYTLKNALATVHKRQNTKLDTVLRHLKAYTPDNVAMAKQIGLQMDMTVDEITLQEERLYQYLQTVVNQEREMYEEDAAMFEKYLAQFICAGEKVAILDVGWNGTAQKAIQIAQTNMGLDAQFQGYYLGVNKLKYRREKGICMQGYLADETSSAQERTRIKAVMGFLELFLTAPHGTTIAYRDQDGEIVPILQKYELLDGNGNARDDIRFIEQMQAGALAFIKAWSDSPAAKGICLTPKEAASPLLQLCCKPRAVDLKSFGDVLFFDSSLTYFAKPKSSVFYFFHPSELKKDFGDSTWKPGFIRRLCHNFPAPYYQIYAALLALYNK